ncbi:hypothetical protein [Hydrogenophaga sp. BPS33]|uniref:hypothetical protein n=1 Tax=Hydrogenophaga sp. BPS33 TaxID=2651974 RepID=UPI0013202895|nr:hypothetical protein [Hydrogenophaga sp. BPS33]QHE86657.1 hypothetical protein F9K07_18005 [Hydrogenophaga sp. BPS33]
MSWWAAPLAAAVVLAVSTACAWAVLHTQRAQTQAVQQALEARQALAALAAGPAVDPRTGEHLPHADGATQPAQWPQRMAVDEVLQFAGASADAGGVLLRSLTVAHTAATERAWGKVTLEVSATGSHGALKAWQAAMQEHFPALSVANLRIQNAQGSMGGSGLDMQSVWVLPVQDPDAASTAAANTVGSLGQRAALTLAPRDPFQLPVPLPRSAPPAVVVAAPVVVAPIVPHEPTPSLRFAGRMLAPDGRTVVLAQWADGTPARLEAGKDVGKGFRVERMSKQSVTLLNPQTQGMVQLSLPAMPRFETR